MSSWIDPAAGDLSAALGAPGAPFGAAALAHRGGVPLRRMPGRETLLLEDGPRRLVLKRARGGSAAELLRELLRGGRPRSPARREGESLVALRAAGVPVPRPLGWFEGRRAALPGGGWSGLVMELVEHGETLRTRLARAPQAERRRWLARLLELVVRLHAAGFYHRDLYVHHVVIATGAPDRVREPDWVEEPVSVEGEGGESLVLLDAGRVRRRRRPRKRWLVKDLAALDASAPGAVSDRERLRFLLGWLRGTGRGRRADTLAWARAARRKAARMRAHVPRHEDLAAPEVPPAEGRS